jgi:enoyl-CoA hydratase
MPGGGLTARLPRLVGVNRARQMSFTGDFIDARRAYDWGLVNEVLPHDRLVPRAIEIAAAIGSIPSRNVQEIRAMYDVVGALAGDAAWARQEEWARAWMDAAFDQARLADQRAAIVARGSSQQVTRPRE